MKILPWAAFAALILGPMANLTPVAGAFSESGTRGSRKHAHAQNSGPFDYYLLNLSWAPEFCHNKSGSPECSGHFGFVVHGLWPQYSKGGYPESCGTAPGPSNPSQMLDIMPDLHLIQHEWSVHGTCSGLSADDYFALIRRDFTSVKIPSDFVSAPRQFTISPADLKSKFEQSNPDITNSDMAISCGGGSYLVAVEICLTKDGKPTQCGSDIRDCSAPTIRVPAIQ
jgi:ribonuclease T2